MCKIGMLSDKEMRKTGLTMDRERALKCDRIDNLFGPESEW